MRTPHDFAHHGRHLGHRSPRGPSPRRDDRGPRPRFSPCPMSLADEGATAGWERVRTEDGIVVSRKEVAGSSFLAFRGEGDVDANILTVGNVLVDVPHEKDWIDGVVDATILRKVSDTEHIMYSHLGMPVPLSDRDLVTDVTLTLDPAHKVAHRPDAFGLRRLLPAPRDRCYVRARIGSVTFVARIHRRRHETPRHRRDPLRSEGERARLDREPVPEELGLQDDRRPAPAGAEAHRHHRTPSSRRCSRRRAPRQITARRRSEPPPERGGAQLSTSGCASDARGVRARYFSSAS